MRTFLPLLVVCALSVAPAWGARATWRNVVSRAWVSDAAVVGDEVWLGFLGGGAACYEPLAGRVDYFTAAEGLGHNYVTAVAADEDHIYFASRNGLTTRARAAGSFQRTVRMWGYAHNDSTDVAVDDRFLYVATLEGARRYDKTTTGVVLEPVPAAEGPPDKLSPQIEDGWRVYINPDGVVLDDLYSVTVTADGVYWGGRGRLFFSGVGAEGGREVDAALPPAAAIRRILATDAGLVIATAGGIFAYRDGVPRAAADPLGGADVRDALAFGGLEYFAAADGLFIRRGDGKPFKLKIGSRAEYPPPKKKSTKKGTLWRVGADDGLPSARCTALATWGEAVVVGTENGACLLEPASGEIRPIPIPHGLPPGGVSALASGEGKIWVATPEGLAAVDEEDGAVEKFPPSSVGLDVRDVIFGGERLMVVTPTGIAVAGFSVAAIKPLFRNNDVVAAEERRAVKVGDEYFVGTSEGLMEFDAGLKLVRVFGPADGFPAAPVRALLFAGNRLFCGTQGGGLAVVDLINNAVTTLRENAGISSDVIFSLAADDNYIYVGTYEKGVDILDLNLKLVRNLSWGDGLSHTDIWAAAVMDGWLWLGVRGVGVNAVNLASLNAAPKNNNNGSEKKPAPIVRRYYARHGLGDEYVKAILPLPPRDGKKRVAFGTASGVAILEYDGEPPDYGADDFDRNYP